MLKVFAQTRQKVSGDARKSSITVMSSEEVLSTRKKKGVH